MVALLAEGVDRNNLCGLERGRAEVALLAEGVDRNAESLAAPLVDLCRPPRGGRG